MYIKFNFFFYRKGHPLECFAGNPLHCQKNTCMYGNIVGSQKHFPHFPFCLQLLVISIQLFNVTELLIVKKNYYRLETTPHEADIGNINFTSIQTIPRITFFRLPRYIYWVHVQYICTHVMSLSPNNMINKENPCLLVWGNKELRWCHGASYIGLSANPVLLCCLLCPPVLPCLTYICSGSQQITPVTCSSRG